MTTAIAESRATGTLDDFLAGIPGVYHDIPAETYHAMDAASKSRLCELSRSPMHCRWSIDNPDEKASKGKSLGTAEHGCLLEPDQFRHDYVLGPDVDLRTKVGKEEWAACEAVNPGKCIVRGKDGEKLIGMHDAVWAHPEAIKAITLCKQREVSVLWVDKNTGQLCKLRADLLGDNIIFDIKTTTDASPEGFAWAIRKFKYDYQVAFYLRGLAAAGMMREGFGFIAVESDAPHGVGVYTLVDEDIAEADRAIFGSDGLLGEYAACVRRNEWPGYSSHMRVLKLPSKRRDAIV